MTKSNKPESNKPAKIFPVTSRMVVGRTPSGSASFNCGDAVAEALSGRPIEQIQEIAKALGVGFDESGEWKYHTTKGGRGMSNGHQRMIIGHVFRGLVRKHDREREALIRAAESNAVPPPEIQTGAEWFNEVVINAVGPLPAEEDAAVEEDAAPVA